MDGPAAKIIELCGGFKAVARMTGRNETRVRRWTYPKDRGGTGGFIPSEAQQLLIREARAIGVPLEPRHFFPEPLPPVQKPCEGAQDRGAA